jgi:hypothetical protein
MFHIPVRLKLAGVFIHLQEHWSITFPCDNIDLCVRGNVAYIYLKRKGLAAH